MEYSGSSITPVASGATALTICTFSAVISSSGSRRGSVSAKKARKESR